MSDFGSSEEKKLALIRIDLSIKTWVYVLVNVSHCVTSYLVLGERKRDLQP